MNERMHLLGKPTYMFFLSFFTITKWVDRQTNI